MIFHAVLKGRKVIGSSHNPASYAMMLYTQSDSAFICLSNFWIMVGRLFSNTLQHPPESMEMGLHKSSCHLGQLEPRDPVSPCCSSATSVRECVNSLWLKTPGAIEQIVYIANYLESFLPGKGPEEESILEETGHQHLYFPDQSRIT